MREIIVLVAACGKDMAVWPQILARARLLRLPHKFIKNLCYSHALSVVVVAVVVLIQLQTFLARWCNCTNYKLVARFTTIAAITTIALLLLLLQ